MPTSDIPCTYHTLAEPGQAEFKDKGSRFIAFAYPVRTAAEVKKHVDALRQEHHKARHWCYAYRLGTDGLQFRESQRNTKAIFSWIGYKKKEIFYDRDPRLAGQTKWNYRKLINLAIDGITSFTTAPLRMATIFGFIISFVAFCWIIYLLVRPLFGVPTGAGYSSLMAVILFLGGVQLLSLGIIGEYVGRIFIETKNRPLYLIEEYHAGNRKKTRR